MNSVANKRPVSRRAKVFLETMVEESKKINNELLAEMYREALVQLVRDNDASLFLYMEQLERAPVSVEEFIDGEEFLGATDLTMWPEVRKAIIEMAANWWRGLEGGAYNEAILSGATGTGKSTIAMVLTMYHLYLLSCLKNPQAVYGLPKATAIVFALMGAKPRVVNKVLYVPMKKMIEAMPYFQKYFMPSKMVESEMYFEEKNIRVAQSGGDEDAILGEAIIGGIVDEINFMNVVLRSKKAEVTSGRAGLYDQATTVHSTMMRRKKGRFTRRGPAIGMVFASSSTKYNNDFTSKHERHVRDTDLRTCYVYNRRQFDVQPKDRYSGKTFRLVIGNEAYHDTRVLKDGEEMPRNAWIEEVPIEYLDDFKKDPYSALRDVMGISHNALSPFIKTRSKVYECVQVGAEQSLKSFLLKDHVILGVDGMPQVQQGHYCMNPSRPRYVHIDLSRTGDRCGIAMLRFDGMVEVSRGNRGETSELLPKVTVEMAVSIEPDANNEIDVAEVRSFVALLKDRFGYPIKGVSYDGVDSRESIQQWRKKGMVSTMISVDRTSVPYKQLRDAMYDGRVALPADDEVLTELFDLEYDENKDKIDHPVNGSKDIADAICGAYTNMLERKSTWSAAAADEAAYHEERRAADAPRFNEPRR